MVKCKFLCGCEIRGNSWIAVSGCSGNSNVQVHTPGASMYRLLDNCCVLL